MGLRFLVLAALLLAGLVPASAQAPRRVALVIANAAYAHASQLGNPPNDARLVSQALARAGFQTIVARSDLSVAAMRTTLRDFRTQAAGAQVALVYYAGHGIESGGRNWLIPTDAKLASDLDLIDEAIDLDRVLSDVAGADLRVVILDACRDNPFGRSWRGGTRTLTRGLGAVDVDDVLVIFAAAPGQQAADGTGGNSPFATALARRLPEPDLAIQLLGNVVRDDVLAATANQQRPFVSQSMTGTAFALVAGPNTMLRDAERELAETRRQAEAERVAALARRQTAEREEQLAVESSRLRQRELEQRQAEAQAAAEELRKAQQDAVAYQAQRRAEVDAEAARTRQTALDAEVERRRLAAESARRRLEATAQAPVVPVVSNVRPYAGPIASPPGSAFQECAQCPEMVVIPAGRFMMGSPRNEEHRFRGEGPQHMVSVPAFAAGRFEVTFAEWDSCATAGGCRSNPRPADQGWGRGRRPVVNVSWNDAQEYITWLNGRAGRAGYRLLSEAEWEYVVRAGSTTIYPWGNDPNGGCAYENHSDMTARRENSGWTTSTCDDGTGDRTAEVGRFRANAFGLHDVNGNVNEWVMDCLRSSIFSTYENAPTDGSAVTADNCTYRMTRGGNFSTAPKFLRSAMRTQNGPDVRRSYQGFRVARSLPAAAGNP